MATIITIGNARHVVEESKKDIDNMIFESVDTGYPIVELHDIVHISSMSSKGESQRQETQPSTYLISNIIKYS